jgi:hypothetical protein
MRPQPFVLVVPALLVAALISACHEPESRNPIGVSTPGLFAAEILGPASVAPGQSVQLTAHARMADGTIKGVTGTSVVWTSSDPSVLQISSTGVVTGRQVGGEAVVRAEVAYDKATRVAQRALLVMPEGTFRIAGAVREEDFPNLPVPGARVEVTTGEASAVTAPSGQYRLYGVPPAADIRVTADGYETEIRHVTLSANATVDVLVRLTNPRPSLTGNYTLAIDAGSGCQGLPALAPALQHRTYDATIAQNGAVLNVTLPEPRFRLHKVGIGDRFNGQAFGGGASFSFIPFDAYDYFYWGLYPYVVESLPGATFLVPYGTAVTSVSASGLSGTLQGGLVQYDSRFPRFGPERLGSCDGTLQFAFIRK